MDKVIAALCGDKAAEILGDYIASLTDDEKYKILDGIEDVLCESIRAKAPVLSNESAMEFLTSMKQRTTEIIPSYTEKLDKEFKETMEVLEGSH